jgi:hypothetical protein
MATNTINENVEQAILDFGTIKQAIINKGVSVPTGTPTSQYATKISSIPTGADVSNVTATAGDVDTGKVVVNSSGTEVTGTSTYKADYTALNTLVGQTTATDRDVASGKLYVKSDGTQGTGTASGGGDEEYINYLNRTVGSVITLPNGAIQVPDYAFYKETSISDVILPDTISSIKTNAFAEVAYPSSLPNSISNIGNYAFYKAYTPLSQLPNSLQIVGNYAFASTYRLASNLTIPASVRTINMYAFSQINGNGLKTVTFLGKPSTLSSTAFSYNTPLTTIRVPWASGEVSGAPWGASNANIIYNYTP